MPLQAIFICDKKGKPIISRNYRGRVPLSVTDEFRKLLAETEENDRKPVMNDGEFTFAFIEHNDLYVMAVSLDNSNVMIIMKFLYNLVEVLEEYFGTLEQESIRDNFVLIYELFDEMNDFGYPQVSAVSLLKDFICIQEKHKLELLGASDSTSKASDVTASITGTVSWRKDGIKHKKNEVFLDVVEKLNLLVAPNGSVLHSEILGCLKMKSFLSGMPELKLGLNDKIMMERRSARRRKSGHSSSKSSSSSSKSKCIEMDDITFHQCVRLQRFESERVISFIPPDGEFDLMTYRLDTSVRPLIWIECHRDVKSHCRVEFMVKCKSEFKRRSTANNVEILIPVPLDVDNPKFKVGNGHCTYVPELNCIKWVIKQLNGQKECLMKAHFGLPTVTAEDAGQESTEKKEPIRVSFEIPYFTVSGIQVRYLKIVEKSGYSALPWVRYITQNGDYQIRMH